MDLLCFCVSIPLAALLRLVHINGNAIYNVEHPWTVQLLTYLEDPSFEVDSTLQRKSSQQPSDAWRFS